MLHFFYFEHRGVGQLSKLIQINWEILQLELGALDLENQLLLNLGLNRVPPEVTFLDDRFFTEKLRIKSDAVSQEAYQVAFEEVYDCLLILAVFACTFHKPYHEFASNIWVEIAIDPHLIKVSTE